MKRNTIFLHSTSENVEESSATPFNVQHLLLENTYVRYKYSELLSRHKKLQNDHSTLNRKLENLYKNNANAVLLLQEKKEPDK